MPYNSRLATKLDMAEEVAARYDIDALAGLLAGARALAADAEISVAVLGRFKAGKSSFLNHFLGRSFLPSVSCRLRPWSRKSAMAFTKKRACTTRMAAIPRFRSMGSAATFREN